MRPSSRLGKLLGRLAPALLLAVLASAMLAGTVLADTTVTAGQTVSTTQGATRCDPNSNEILFVLNGIVGTVPSSIDVTFKTSSGVVLTPPVTFLDTFTNPVSTTAHYSLQITSANDFLTFDTIVGASFIVPTGMTSYGQF